MSGWSEADHIYMSRALQLAAQGTWTTDPNPRVGCVLVVGNKIVGEGYHRRAGEGHAEVNALAQAGEAARGATAYVTLEPCCHHGRTPPCADALIKAGVTRVVSAMVDPNPQVSGRGIERLKQAGIQAESGLLQAQAERLNPGFIKRMQTGLPFVRIKLASSLDGRTAMASGESQWITGPAARADVQQLRARSTAIMTGVESILMDDSALTVRSEQLNLPDAEFIAQRQPLRVVLDSKLRMPLNAKILQEPRQTLLVTCSDEAERIEAFKQAGAQVFSLPADEQGQVPLMPLLQWLAAEHQVNELLVETGATLAGACLQQKLADELVIYQAMTLMGSEARPLLALPLAKMQQQVRLQRLDSRWLGDDHKLVLRPVYGEGV
ncbi:bifunctional diaminohydroxyphosphoribosylaminopyrimidine deaminase/5-amino-6-(5-phosphoribosylamino)uracil reductase RibD [Neptuniibacter sp. CAU 1671]|uniref:bifunctional diaminohydroxyphosphoribosylaminopyrimidine deaminase/5-amino-6-(5-phosphoribosylamino)uracil reductase RibD n=1 Tax=Neptuniibacter sp. CAU 1671 TaxID=3032593 RepID=UPI0023DBC1FF|nr:bifunctional diaminohydroxyphosphoribosylaminopyrimidine deaminase/5-amino-6-(5-phosphoribosylamino)uracil reductase RibD [Neptuniibacter sp. CAU 1671]MDF2181676.1 bifunctional diaminohydroxyphosphoribosylaminopyrimidine deaminase/5-amino-6-(5-phosphoribosylamino)uracil reductase RibD [Neptuniibacter sp. CAU 1671]